VELIQHYLPVETKKPGFKLTKNVIGAVTQHDDKKIIKLMLRRVCYCKIFSATRSFDCFQIISALQAFFFYKA